MFREPLQHILAVIYTYLHPFSGTPSITLKDTHTVSTDLFQTVSAKIQCQNTITTPVFNNGKIY